MHFKKYWENVFVSLKIFTCIRNNPFAFSVCWKKTVVKLPIDGVVSFKFIEISTELPHLNDSSPHVGQMIIEAFIGAIFFT